MRHHFLGMGFVEMQAKAAFYFDIGFVLVVLSEVMAVSVYKPLSVITLDFATVSIAIRTVAVSPSLPKQLTIRECLFV
ncbi:hypothetical protein [Endozoicomonas sp. 4G]|uniref:hypothetical protein n=1 Tax=Endozoicomonas sp. 4G TaxID=2872754 RepID=UPI002078B4E2|nr:hypothetical protein [Endozoicomonas sp. 4G]